MIRLPNRITRLYSSLRPKSSLPIAPYRSSKRTSPIPKSEKPTPELPPRQPTWTSRILDPSRSALNLLYNTAKFLLPLFLLTHLAWHYLFEIVSPFGASMLPTLYLSGQWVLLSKWYRRGRGIEVGDIVSISHPFILHEGAIKRVIGMPGDFVLAGTPGVSGMMVKVPRGHCWLAGDNQEWSRDSRYYGAVPLALVRGKVVWRFAPRRERVWFKNPLKKVEEVDEMG
jgi:inner membrane protease subunit 1